MVDECVCENSLKYSKLMSDVLFVGDIGDIFVQTILNYEDPESPVLVQKITAKNEDITLHTKTKKLNIAYCPLCGKKLS